MVSRVAAGSRAAAGPRRAMETSPLLSTARRLLEPPQFFERKVKVLTICLIAFVRPAPGENIPLWYTEAGFAGLSLGAFLTWGKNEKFGSSISSWRSGRLSKQTTAGKGSGCAPRQPRRQALPMNAGHPVRGSYSEVVMGRRRGLVRRVLVGGGPLLPQALQQPSALTAPRQLPSPLFGP